LFDLLLIYSCRVCEECKVWLTMLLLSNRWPSRYSFFRLKIPLFMSIPKCSIVPIIIKQQKQTKHKNHRTTATKKKPLWYNLAQAPWYYSELYSPSKYLLGKVTAEWYWLELYISRFLLKLCWLHIAWGQKEQCVVNQDCCRTRKP